ncbi:MAG: peptidase, partial [Bacteroidetes bacterium CG_4_9_14_3_um_filter_41_19]
IRWNVDFVDNLLYLRWQDAVKTLHERRDPLEAGFFAEQSKVDSTTLELIKINPEIAKKYLTDLTIKRMEQTQKLFQDLRLELISKYTNNKQGI